MTDHAETGIGLRHINLGGGFPVNYLRRTIDVDRRFPRNSAKCSSADFEPAEAISRGMERQYATIAESANASHLLDDITLLARTRPQHHRRRRRSALPP